MSINLRNNDAAHISNTISNHYKRMNESIDQAASGSKINSAKDDASAFAISNRMDLMIRTLNQDAQNVQNGQTLLKVALSGVEDIVNELRNLKELATNAATATNTDNDRRALTKMFSEGIANINEIADSTRYNGKSLLNGNYSDYTVTTTKEVTTTQTVNVPVDSESARAANVMQVSRNLSLTKANLSAATKSADYTTDSNGNITITSNGEFNIDSSVAGKTITVAAKNVKLVGNGEQVNASVNVTASDAHLTIENLNLSKGIKFSKESTNNMLTVVGENKISGSGFEAAVNIGGGLIIKGDGNITANASISMAAAIGTNYSEQSSANITITGNVTVNATAMSGAAIGSGSYNSSVGKIEIYDAKVTATSKLGAGIGSGQSSNVGDINIYNGADVTATSNQGAGIGGGKSSNITNNITIYSGATVYAEAGNNSSAIGSSNGSSNSGSITIYSGATVTAIKNPIYDNDSDVIKANTEIIYSDSSVTENGKPIAENARNEEVTYNVGKTPPTISEDDPDDDISDDDNTDNNNEPVNEPDNPPIDITPTVTPSTITVTTTSTDIETIHTPLSIHFGVGANQSVNVKLNDMHTKALIGGDIVSNGKLLQARDIAQYNAISGNTDKQAELLVVLAEAQGKSVTDADISTQHGANVAMRIVDNALEYATEQATQIGAAVSRMSYAHSVIVTNGENTQAAHSTVSDSDVANVMTRYNKNNMLMNAAQSMLAQANQFNENILSLLR